jgi:hypothetical protein
MMGRMRDSKYKEQGIYVCARWTDIVNGFRNFVLDNGLCGESGFSLERLNNIGPYSPENTAWLHKSYQSRNKETCLWVRFRGVWYRFIELCEKRKLKYATCKDRWYHGFDVEDVFCKGELERRKLNGKGARLSKNKRDPNVCTQAELRKLAPEVFEPEKELKRAIRSNMVSRKPKSMIVWNDFGSGSRRQAT